MEATQTVINALLLGAFTTITWFVTRAQSRTLERRIDRHEERSDARIDRFEDKLTARIDGVESKLTARIDGVESKLTARIDGVGSRVEALRTDLTQLAFRLGEHPHPQTG